MEELEEEEISFLFPLDGAGGGEEGRLLRASEEEENAKEKRWP